MQRNSNWCGLWTDNTTFNFKIIWILVAIEIMLSFSPFGFILIRPISLTTSHIVVMLGAMWSGPVGGGILGLVFGLCSMWKAEATAVNAVDIIFAPFRNGTFIDSLILSLGSRTIYGIIAGLLFLALFKLAKKQSVYLLPIMAVFLDRLHSALVYHYMDTLFHVKGINALGSLHRLTRPSTIAVCVFATFILVGFYYFLQSKSFETYYKNWLKIYESNIKEHEVKVFQLIVIALFIISLMFHITTRTTLIYSIEKVHLSEAGNVRFVHVLAQYLLAVLAMLTLVLDNFKYRISKEHMSNNERLQEKQEHLEALAAEQEAQIEETNSLNRQLQENQAKLEEAIAENETQRIKEQELIKKDARIHEELSMQRAAEEAVATIHEVLNSGNWSMTFNEQGRLASCNWSEAFRRMLGFKDIDSFPNKLESWFNLLHSEDKEKVLTHYWEVAEDHSNQKTYDTTYRLLTNNSEYKWYRAVGRLTRRANGTPINFYGVLVDINERMLDQLRLEAAYKEAEEAKESLNLAYEEQKSQLEEISSLNAQLQKNQNHLEEMTSEQESQIEEITTLNNTLEENQAQLEEAAAENEAQLEEIKAAKEELEASQEALEEAKEAAEAANEAKTTFLNNMSHDIRTPMNAILGFTMLIEKSIDNPVEIKKSLRKIKSSGEYLLSIINNVLDMARIESGKVSLNPDFVNLQDPNDNILSVFEEEFHKKKLKTSFELDVEHPYVLVDIAKTNQIVVNLVSNAIKYTPVGGSIAVKMQELPCSKPGYGAYCLTISDTGIGMSKEYLETIFEAFTREKNTTESKIIGTGLGMAIVKKLVDFMNGKIEIDSELGRGTTFRVTFEHQIVDKPESYIKKQEENIVKSIEFTGKRILLAEDNELNAEIAIAILEDVGFIVDHVEDGVACVEMLNSKDVGYYDVILMDIQMPYMNGYEATARIRQLADKAKANIPILAMTANAFEEDKRKSIEAGMDGFCTKPIDVEQLNKELARIFK